MLLYLPLVPQSGMDLKVSYGFTSQDLFLVDRMSSGDSFAMLSGPLDFKEKKNAVYFFNPNDLQKINLEKFGNVYLITSEENVAFYQESAIGKNLRSVSNYQMSRWSLEEGPKSKKEMMESSVDLPLATQMIVNGKIFQYLK